MTPLEMRRLYEADRKTMQEISAASGIPISTVRNRLLAVGTTLRPKIPIKGSQHAKNIGAKLRGRKRITPEMRAKMAEGQRASAERTSVGVTLKPNGYLVYTRGPHKGKGVHSVVAETRLLRRPLRRDEVVHHIDGNKLNNRVENLQVMTRVEHARVHAFENLSKRTRDEHGRFT